MGGCGGLVPSKKKKKKHTYIIFTHSYSDRTHEELVAMGLHTPDRIHEDHVAMGLCGKAPVWQTACVAMHLIGELPGW